MTSVHTTRILMVIKMKNEITASVLASELGVTKEGARLNLLKLVEEGLVRPITKSEGVGRPTTYYTLSDKGLAALPDAHARVTVELLQSVKQLLGENALDLLIGDREKQTHQRYENALDKASTLEQRLEILVRLRSEEGYMAEWKRSGKEYLLIENHCPICAAAVECQGFCRAELRNFRSLIGAQYQVERINHLITDGHRCVYRITKAIPA